MAGIGDRLSALFGSLGGNIRDKASQLNSFLLRGSDNDLLAPVPRDELLDPITRRASNPRRNSFNPPQQRQQAPPPRRNPADIQSAIDSGLSSSGFSNAPVATMSSQLAQAGSQLPQAVDPLLPLILSLMESGGGRHLSSENNLFNLGPGISYPDLSTSILGGGPEDQLGLMGVLGKNYPDFLESGDLNTLFSRFTPQSDPRNPSTEELIERYNSLRSLFEL